MLTATIVPNRSDRDRFVRNVQYARRGDTVAAREVYMTFDRTRTREVPVARPDSKDWSRVPSGKHTAKRDWLIAMGVLSETPFSPEPELLWVPDGEPLATDESGKEGHRGFFIVERY